MSMEEQRERLVSEIIEMGIRDERVIDAVRRTKRELFVPEEFLDEAYANHPLHIGHDQTISQPYTVALMIQLLDIKGSNRILEIGAGSGYNAAVMSNLIGKEGRITAVEVIPELAENAKRNLEKACIKNVEVIHADGSKGYEEGAPYDRIIVTAASSEIMPAWIRQLREGGIIVVPVGRFSFGQIMIRATKKGDSLEREEHGSFMFVPLRTDKSI